MTDAEKTPARKRAGQVALQDLETGDCRWPVGDPKRGPFGFCGCAQEPDSPYCADHRRLAFVQREVLPAKREAA